MALESDRILRPTTTNSGKPVLFEGRAVDGDTITATTVCAPDGEPLVPVWVRTPASKQGHERHALFLAFKNVVIVEAVSDHGVVIKVSVYRITEVNGTASVGYEAPTTKLASFVQGAWVYGGQYVHDGDRFGRVVKAAIMKLAAGHDAVLYYKEGGKKKWSTILDRS